MKKDDVLGEWQETEETFDEKNARKLVWRTRLSISFILVRTLLVILLLYVAYIVPVSIYYHGSDHPATFDRLVTTLIESSYPAISVERSGINHVEISPLLTQSTVMTLYRQVGDWEVVVGEVTATKRLFGQLDYHVDITDKYLDREMTSYVLAPELRGDSFPNNHVDYSPVANQLSHIADGYVVQTSFSTVEGMTPEQLRKIIMQYDLRVYEMPVFAGELAEFDVNYFSADEIYYVDSLLLTPATHYDHNNARFSWNRSLSGAKGLKDSVEQFTTNIEWLVENGNYYGKDIDQKRLTYLKSNELLVYGAMVTGPIREVEKLMGEELFHTFELGGIEVWNWEE